MATIRNKEQFEAWLETQPPEVALALASRAALRVFTTIAEIFLEEPEQRAADLVLPLFRTLALPWFGSQWQPQGGAFPTPLFLTAARSRSAAAAAAAFAAFAAGRLHNEPTWAASEPTWAVRAAEAASNADITGVSWLEIYMDAEVIEKGLMAEEVMRRPLWANAGQGWVDEEWERLKSALLDRDEDWEVWTGWYEDRLWGADDARSRPVIPKLELRRIQIPEEDWEKGPKHVNAIIAALEAEYRASVPPQRLATIEVEYREDGKLHRRAGRSPEARDAAQEERLRAAWTAHSEQLASLEQLEPGRNSLGLGRAIVAYRAALGPSFDEMNVIALGVHGAGLQAHAAAADALLLEDALGELKGLAAAHGLFIQQFDAWRDYVSDAAGDPTEEIIAAAIGVARSVASAPEVIAEDLAVPINELADAAVVPMDAEADQPPRLIKVELLRSLGNMLSAMFAPLVKFARDAGSKAREQLIEGIGQVSKLVPLALAFGGTAYVAALATGLPAEFGWLVHVLEFLKTVLAK